MSVVEKADRAITSLERKAEAVGKGVTRSAVGVANVASSVGTGVSEAIKYGVESGRKQMEGFTAAQNAKKAVPDMANITDAFHRKLYSYADFDYLIKYLQANNLAACKNIYTRDSLVQQIAQASGEALDHRSVGCLNRLYFATLRLCLRRRKGLLAYINLNAGVTKKILSWQVFLEYAGFANLQTADDIWLPTGELFPTLKKVSRRVKSTLKHENKDAVVSGSDATEQEQLSVGIDEGDSTSMFAGRGSINYSQMLVLLYNQAAAMSSELSLNKGNSFDVMLFFACYLTGGSIKVTTLDELVANMERLRRVFKVDDDFKTLVVSSSGDFLRPFRQLWELPEGNGNSNQILVEALGTYLNKNLTVDSDFAQCYSEQVDLLCAKINKILESVSFHLTEGLPADAAADIQAHNAKIFESMYTQIVSDVSKFKITADNVFDAVMCLVLYQKYKVPNMTLEQYVVLTERAFNEIGIPPETFVMRLADSPSNCLQAIRCSKNIAKSGSSIQNFTMLSNTLIQMAMAVLEVTTVVQGDPVSGLIKLFEVYVAKKIATETSGITQQSAKDYFI